LIKPTSATKQQTATGVALIARAGDTKRGIAKCSGLGDARTSGTIGPQQLSWLAMPQCDRGINCVSNSRKELITAASLAVGAGNGDGTYTVGVAFLAVDPHSRS
jgi:hypothetical protein